MQTRYELILTALDRSLQSTLSAAGSAIKKTIDAVKVFNTELQNGGKAAQAVSEKINNLVRAYLSFEGARKVLDIVKESDASFFKLQTSVDGANKSFANVGSAKEWETTIEEMSGKLKVYSQSSLRDAVAQTIKMGSQLGLEKDQMASLVERTANLSAGKMNLNQASEIMLKALKGEMRGLDELGIALEEKYVRGWYDAKVAHEGAYESLSENEKVQVRLAAILEATATSTGRASEYAKTLSGSWDMVKASVSDAIEKNENVSAAMKDVANALNENSGEIGQIVAWLIKWVAWLIDLAAQHEYATLAIVALVGLFPVIKTGISTVSALGTAFKSLMGMGFGDFFMKLNSQFSGVYKGLSSLSATLGTLGAVAAAAFAGWEIGKVIGEIPVVQQFVQNLYATIDEYFTKIKIKILEVRVAWNEFTGDTAEAESLRQRIAVEKEHLDVIERTKNSINTAGAVSKKAAGDAKTLADAQDKGKKSAEDLTKQIDKFEKSAQDAYKKAASDAKKYADEISKLKFAIGDREIETADKIREILQGTMEDSKKLADVKLQAYEKEQAAAQSLAEFKQSEDKNQGERTKKLATDAQNYWTAYAQAASDAYKEATKSAEEHAKEIKKLQAEAIDQQTDLEDTIRKLRRQNMSDGQKQVDIAQEAVEKEEAALEELAKFKETKDEEALKRAKEFSEQANSLWTEYASGGEMATNKAIDGLESVADTQAEINQAQQDAEKEQQKLDEEKALSAKQQMDEAIAGITKMKEVLNSVDQTQITIFQRLQADAETAMVVIKKQLDDLAAQREANIKITLQGLEDAERRINDLVKDEYKVIHIKTVDDSAGSSAGEGMASGGRVGMAAGGRFPGNSAIDSIPVLARPGEGFVRNEALSIWDRLFGTGFFEGINAPWSNMGQKIISAMVKASGFHIPAIPKSNYSFSFATGGRVPDVPFKDMGKTSLVTASGKTFPVMGKINVIEELKKEIVRERLMVRNR